jgi:mannan endo-1,4-beta-mannosidase
MEIIISKLKIIKSRFWFSQKIISVWLFVFVMVLFPLLPIYFCQAQIYVDACASGTGDGTVSNPYSNLSNAIGKAAIGSTINLKCGKYMEKMLIDKKITMTAHGGTARVGVRPDNLWAGVNNGDIFDEPDTAVDPERTLNAMLDELVKANLRVIRIWVDYRLELDENGNALPVGEYNDCILEQIDHLMVEAKQRGLLLLIAFQAANWLGNDYYLSREHYEWRRCKTPEKFYIQKANDPNWVEGNYPSPYGQRFETLEGWNDGNFFTNEKTREAYKKRVEYILNHQNPALNNRKWKDINEVVWAWELMNEPGNSDDVKTWIHEMSSYVKGIDPDTYLATGTIYGFLEEYFKDIDIYTVHLYQTVRPSDIERFNSSDGIGGKYGKLVIIEEFRAAGDNIVQYTNMNVPWMFWEYGYNTDILGSFDLWHSGVDERYWNEFVIPNATTMWNTPNPFYSCDCNMLWKPWRVREMVEALSGP